MSIRKSPVLFTGVATKLSRTISRRLSFVVFLLALVSAGAVSMLPSTAFAAGETFKWLDDTRIVVSGGLVKNPEPQIISQTGGTITLHTDSKTFCVVGLRLTPSGDKKSATLTAYDPTIMSSPDGPSRSCTSQEQSLIDSWKKGTTVTLSSAGNPEETPKQKELHVRLWNKGKKADSPKSVKFTLKKDGKEVKSFSSNIGGDGHYYGTFSNVSPGTYSVCVNKIDDRCQNVTKVKYTSTGVAFGEVAGNAVVEVNMKLNVSPEDPGKDQTYGPYKLVLKDNDGKQVKQKDVTFQYAACVSSVCGGVIHTYRTTSFNDVDPGKYKACIGERCASFTKVLGAAATVELALSESDVEAAKEAGDEKAVCTAGALGWVICPLVNFIADINDTVYDVVENMLYTNPATVETNGPLHATWSRFRDLANVLFVIVFLIVVFSQATSIGLSSYGIKRVLPRIFIAAILVNISFFICQVAIDLSNIVGVGVTQLVNGLHSSADIDINQISWSTVIAAAIGGAGIYAGVAVVLGSGGIAAAIAMLLPFAVTALFAIVTALVVLIARQALIVLLVALAPLAFIATILPNTQKYFQIWQNSFTTLLLMFPLVALLFSGSKLAANIILTSPTSDDGISYFALIAAVSILFLPLFGVPYIVKFSGGLLGRIAGVVNNPNKGPFDALRKRAEGYRDYKRNQNVIRNEQGYGNALQRNTFGRYQRRRTRTDAMRKKVEEFAADASSGYIADESTRNEKFAAQMAGGAKYQGDNLETAVRRVQASGIARERDESRKRVAAIQQRLLYDRVAVETDSNGNLDYTKGMGKMYADAAARGDYETMSAVINETHKQGSFGRQQTANMITQQTIGTSLPGGVNSEEAKAAQFEVMQSVYGLSLPARADIVKGEMKNGRWELKDVAKLATEQKAALDGSVLETAIRAGKISQAEAERIVTTNLRDKVESAALVKQLERIAYPTGAPSSPAPTGGGGPVTPGAGGTFNITNAQQTPPGSNNPPTPPGNNSGNGP